MLKKHMEIETKNNLIETVKAKNAFLEEVGLLRGSSFGEPNREKFAFRLSPDCLEFTEGQRAEMEEINDLMFGEGGFLKGSLKLFDRTLTDPRFTSTPVGSRVVRTLSVGIPKIERGIQRAFQSQIPAMVRIDLALTQKEGPDEPSLRIMEIEGDKTHAFGFVTMIDLFGKEMKMEGQKAQGLVSAFQEILRLKRIDPEKPIALIVGSSERFYEAELGIFSTLAKEQGLNICIIPERELVVEPQGVRSCSAGGQLTDLLMNLPVLTPLGRIGTGVDALSILDLYRDSKIQCLIPPKRFLGNKGLMGLISNGDSDSELETVLEENFSPQKLKNLRRFFPSTIVIGKKNQAIIRSKIEEDSDGFVIKKTVSSGMKGVALPNARQRQEAFLHEAFKNPFNFILQRKIEQETKEFNFAEPDMLDEVKRATMFMRISLFASEVGVAAVGITARETPDVQGARDSIQIPGVFR